MLIELLTSGVGCGHTSIQEEQRFFYRRRMKTKRTTISESSTVTSNLHFERCVRCSDRACCGECVSSCGIQVVDSPLDPATTTTVNGEDVHLVVILRTENKNQFCGGQSPTACCGAFISVIRV